MATDEELTTHPVGFCPPANSRRKRLKPVAKSFEGRMGDLEETMRSIVPMIYPDYCKAKTTSDSLLLSSPPPMAMPPPSAMATYCLPALPRKVMGTELAL